MTHHERNLQIAVVRYVRAQYPHCLIHHPANGEKRDAKTGSILKKMGVLAGFPDLILCPEHKPVFFLELKTDKGTLRANQKEVMDKLSYNGHAIAVAYGFDEAKTIIDNYLKN